MSEWPCCGKFSQTARAELAKVDEFRYLGSMMQENRKCEREVKKWIQVGWSKWRKVSGIICDRKLSTRVKGKVYNTAIRSAMLYGMETVVLMRRQEIELEVAELRMLRFAMGVMRLDKIKNTHVRETVNVVWIGKKVRETRLRWYGHVLQRNVEYVGKWVIGMDFPGKRRRGRPLRRYMDIVKEDLVVGATEKDTEDRTKWRRIIHSGNP